MGTCPQFSMKTLSRFVNGFERFRGCVEKPKRDPANIAVVLRALSAPGARPDAIIDDEAEMFADGDVDWSRTPTR